MPRELLLSLLVEALLVTSTILFLVGPRTILPVRSPGLKSFLTGTGFFLLSVTFCWSVIFGAILAIHQATARI